MPGPLALVGSGEFTASMRSVDTLLLANGTGRRVLVVPTAAAADGTEAVAAVVRAAQEHFASLDAEVVVSGVRQRSGAVREAALPDDVDVIYLPDGNVGRRTGIGRHALRRGARHGLATGPAPCCRVRQRRAPG
jgi:cyanophycinase